MGCSTSRLDNLPAVALCRDRCKFLDEAIRCSHSLADAHSAYMESLKTLGLALHRFFHQNHTFHTHSPPINGDPIKPSPPEAATFDHSPSSSDSDSQQHFPSDSGDEDSEKEFGGSLSPAHEQYISDHIFTNYTYYGSKQSPPPPPSNSTWEFLNFFDTFERYEPALPPVWDRESVGKPEVKPAADKDKKERAVVTDQQRAAGKNSKAKKDHAHEEKKNPDLLKNVSKERGVSDLMKEIQLLFEKASDSGNEVSKLLCYRQRIGSNQVCGYLGFENWRSLSCTLKKICIWEKKLYVEVKDEERLRLTLEKKCRQLKQMDEKRGDARRMESTRTLIRDLSTKLKVSIQVVDRISITISKLRDGELRTHITDLIHGLLGMWKAMSDCFKNQHRTIAEIKTVNITEGSDTKLEDDHLEATMQLKFELQNWMLSFSNWTVTQKDYVRSLNGWLLRCLLYEPEETLDGLLPFSPAQIGAPPVFGTCNYWSQAVEKISEKELIEAMRSFITSIDRVLERHNADVQQRLISDKDMERKAKMLDKEEQKVMMMMMHADVEEKRRLSLHSLKTLRPNDQIVSSSNMQFGLKQIFIAMERFTGNSMQAYEELFVRIEEVKVGGAEDLQTGP